MVQNLAEIAILAQKAGVLRHAFVNLDWTTTFTPTLSRKDLDLGFAAARALDVPAPVIAAACEALQAHFGAASLQPDPGAYLEKDFAPLLERLPIRLNHRHCERSEAIYASVGPSVPTNLRSRRDGWLRFARHDGGADSI